LEAAARIFAEVGLERATTARIAEVAGVSPGSMYQYFPNKDSLIVALYEREVERQLQVFQELVARVGTESPAALIRALVEWALDDMDENKPLNRVFFEEVPRLAGLDIQRQVDDLASRNIRALFELAKDAIKPTNVQVASVLVVRAFRYSVLGALLDGPLEGKPREAFVTELSDLLTAYLVAPRTWR
jgi:AcrR family transcriptional regulator